MESIPSAFRPDLSLPFTGCEPSWVSRPPRILIAHVARVDPMKDHATFLAALGMLNRAEALLIGPDTERLATPSNVHALGSRDDVERLLAAADLVVSSSDFGENFSNALAEGMAAGLPAVATDVGDSARIVGCTGRIVPPREPAALARAMGELLSESKTARAVRGSTARRRIETHFSVAARSGCPQRTLCVPAASDRPANVRSSPASAVGLPGVLVRHRCRDSTTTPDGSSNGTTRDI